MPLIKNIPEPRPLVTRRHVPGEIDDSDVA
jgi:hypothetical protein